MVGDRVIVTNMTGICTCYQATTGKELWQARLGGNFTGSPVVSQGLVYTQNEVGETIVIKPDDKLHVVARNKIDVAEGELFRSSLAPSDGQIFMRSSTTLYCVGERDQP
jgi:outer membrane protein assembly factor BamB